MHHFEQCVLETLNSYAMTEGAHRIVVGYSGGADSTALLFALKACFDGELLAVHLNHQLRGEESVRDQHFVERVCQQAGIPLVVETVDIATLAKERKCSVEVCGRQERYHLFASQCTCESDHIATAHTLSDSGETMLLRLTRGSGVGGLCGIAPVQGRVIRPLRFVTREEVEAYCKEKNLPYVEDSSNRSMVYARNRIRHQVLPQLKELNPRVIFALERTAKQLTEQEQALTHYANLLEAASQVEGGLATNTWHSQPKAVVCILLRNLLRQQGVGEQVTDQKIEAMYQAAVTGHAVCPLGKLAKVW